MVDAAYKSTGTVTILAGSGDDTISIAAARTNLDFKAGAPVSEDAVEVRDVNTHLVDLSASDALDIASINTVVDDVATSTVDESASTNLLASGVTTTAIASADIDARTTVNSSTNVLSLDLGQVDMSGTDTGLAIAGVKIPEVDLNSDGDTLDEGDRAEIAAPIMPVTGKIEVSLGNSSLIATAIANNTDSDGLTQDLFEGLDGDDANSTNGDPTDYDSGLSIYKIDDALIWLDTV